MSIVSKLIPRLAFNEQLLIEISGELVGYAINRAILQDGLSTWCERSRDLKKLTRNWLSNEEFKKNEDCIKLWEEFAEKLLDEQVYNDLFHTYLCRDIIGYKYDKATTFPELSQFLLDYLYVDILVCSGDEYYLKTNSSLIERSEKAIEKHIQRTIINNDFRIQQSEDKSFRLTRIKDAKEICNMMYLNARVVDDFRDVIDAESKSKLFFKNGFWDFKKNKFLKYGGITLIQIPYELDLNSNPQVRKEIEDRILNPIFNDDEKKNWFMYKVGRMIAGCREDKNITCVTGNRDCGKGVLSTLLEQCLKQYISTIDLSVFAEKKNRGDVGRENAFVLALEYARIALMNESSTCILDGNRIKQVFSGGDTLMVRKLHHENQQQKIQSSPLIFGNELPQFTTNDVWEKIYELNLTTVFIDADFKEEDKLSTITYFPKDDSVKEVFIKRQDVINEFMLMMIESYNKPVPTPECVLNERKEAPNENQMIREAFVPDEKSFITNKEIKDAIASHHLKMNLKKVKSILKGLRCFSAKDHTTGSARGLKGVRIAPN